MASSGCDPGEPLFVRGRWWTVLACEDWGDCRTVRLRQRDRQGERVLLFPFDRPHRPACPATALFLRPRRWWHRLVETIAGFPRLGALSAPLSSDIRLLAYQLAPSLAVLRHGATRLLIADEVGLGKTIQAGLILAELRAAATAPRFLVVVPAGLRDQWRTELESRFDLDPVVCDTAWLARTATELPAHVNPWALPGTFIVSIDLLKRPEVLAALEPLTWDALILDEAHLARKDTDRRAAVHAVARHASRVVLLTATPHPGQPGEFRALCDIGRIHAGEPPIVMFRRTRTSLGFGPPRRSRLHQIAPGLRTRRLLRLLAAYTNAIWNAAAAHNDGRLRLLAIVLRKRALSGAAALGDSLARRRAALDDPPDPGPLQPRLPLEDGEGDEVPAQVLGLRCGLLMGERRWLRMLEGAARGAAADDRKEWWLRRFLRRVREPVLVFTEYRDTLLRLAIVSHGAGHRVLLLHGGLDRRERLAVQAEFAEGGCSLLATDAAAVGLNLHTRCRVVIHYEMPWTLSRLVQRAGRVDRIGQRRRVHEIALVQADEAERLVLGPLATRAMAAKDDPGGDAVSGLTEDLVGAWVFDGTVPPVQRTGDASSSRSIPLDQEAALEQGHAAACRGAPRHTATGPAPQAAPFVTVMRSARRAPAAASLVVRLSVSDGDGRELHAEGVVFEYRLNRTFVRTMTRDTVRTHVEALQRLLANDRSPLAMLVRTRADSLLDRIRPAYRLAHADPRQRERAIADERSSRAAAVLVQAGLFDRRAVRAAEAQRLEEAARQADAASREAREHRVDGLRAEASLFAVVFHGRVRDSG